MKKYSITRKLVLVAAFLATTVAGAQIYKGIRVPQLNTTERVNIGAEANPANAQGQMIFNTDTNELQYWDGSKWTSLTEGKDTIVGNEVTDAANETLIRTGEGTSASPYKLQVNITSVGDSLLSNPVYVTNFADSIANYINNTYLGDSIAQYISNNFNSTALGDTIMQYISNNINNTYLGDSIAQYISNNFNNTALGDTILQYISNNISNTYLGDSILHYITNDISNNILGDSIIKLINENAVTGVTGSKGIVITNNGSGSVDVGFPSGSADNEILKWNSTTSKWEAAAPTSIVKKLTISINANYTVESVTYTGATGLSTNAIEVVGIQPVIISAQGDGFIAENLGISTTAKVVSDGSIAYVLRIKNDNIEDAQSYTINSLNIYYICSDDLTAGTAPVAKIFVGQ
jgi:hypothetical protein